MPARSRQRSGSAGTAAAVRSRNTERDRVRPRRLTGLDIGATRTPVGFNSFLVCARSPSGKTPSSCPPMSTTTFSSPSAAFLSRSCRASWLTGRRGRCFSTPQVRSPTPNASRRSSPDALSHRFARTSSMDFARARWRQCWTSCRFPQPLTSLAERVLSTRVLLHHAANADPGHRDIRRRSSRCCAVWSRRLLSAPCRPTSRWRSSCLLRGWKADPLADDPSQSEPSRPPPGLTSRPRPC